MGHRAFRSNHAGIALITTFLTIVVVLMLVGAVVILSRGSMGVSGSIRDREAALAAAQAGLAYCQTRLQERPSWCGDGDGVVTQPPPIVSSTDGNLVVIEDNGTVVGWMRGVNGDVSQFRVRFNYHDGPTGVPGDLDGLDDPSYFIRSPYVSVNNLENSAAASVPRPDEGSGDWEVTTVTNCPYNVPSGTVCLIVEGRAGQGLRDALQDPASPVYDPPTAAGRMVVQIAEAYLGKPDAGVVDAVAYSGNELGATVEGTMKVEAVDTADAPRIRTNQNLVVKTAAGTAPTYQTPGNAEVYVKDTIGEFLLGPGPSTLTDPQVIRDTTEKDQFLSIAWSDVAKAAPSDANVAAGTYIWRQGGAVEYYPSTYSGDPALYVPGTGTIVGSLDSGAGAVTIDTSDPSYPYTLRFTKDVFVSSTTDPVTGQPVTGLAIVPEQAILDTGKRPRNVFEAGSSGEVPILSASGADAVIAMEGSITGQGSVVSAKDILFQGESSLESDPATAVALYAQGDVKLQAIPDEVVGAMSGGGNATESTTATGPGPWRTYQLSGPGWTMEGQYHTGNNKWKNGDPKCKSGSPPAWALAWSSPTGSTVYPATAQNQKLKGVVYAQGDFIADMKDALYQGGLNIEGVLVAYGGKPGVDDPGTGGKGKIAIKATDVEFRYNPDYVENLLGTGPIRLERKMWANY
ncbi:MAG: hypothetical protein HY319_30050 [Armatimonadetes bacterium]|nr:hypothetical protein [Armatimonadota bacterium]